MPISARDLLDELAANNRAVLYQCRYDEDVSARIVPALTEVLSDSDAEVRRGALSALIVIGSAARAALDEVGRLLDDGEWIVQENAVAAIGRLCLDEPGAALPFLRKAAGDDGLIDQVLHACTSLGPTVHPLSDVFVSAYRNGDAKRRRLAVRCLIITEAKGADVETALQDALSDKHARVRKAAGRRGV